MRYRLHDYTSAGAYFVTFCTLRRRQIFATVAGSTSVLTKAGQAVMKAWNELPLFYPAVALDAFAVMPDHVHGIIFLLDRRYESRTPQMGEPDLPSLSQVMRCLKTRSGRAINLLNGSSGAVWQSGFIDRVVRNESELAKFRGYIETNPLRETLNLKDRRVGDPPLPE